MNPKLFHRRWIQHNVMRWSNSTNFKCLMIFSTSGTSAKSFILTTPAVCFTVTSTWFASLGLMQIFCWEQISWTHAVFILLLYNIPCKSYNLIIIFSLLLICIDALVDTLDLKLVGPFEILAGAHKAAQNSEPNFHLHWRFFYDPPEFQTILLGNQATQHHIGYYRY